MGKLLQPSGCSFIPLREKNGRENNSIAKLTNTAAKSAYCTTCSVVGNRNDKNWRINLEMNADNLMPMLVIGIAAMLVLYQELPRIVECSISLPLHYP